LLTTNEHKLFVHVVDFEMELVVGFFVLGVSEVCEDWFVAF
jgi:hypothetical protein